MTTFISMFPALRHRDFRWLWACVFCSTGGQWMQTATLGWVVYDMTGSGTLLGAVLGVRGIPMLLLAPLSGVFADRYDRRRMLAAAQVPMVATSFLLALALALDVLQVWHLFAFTLLAGVSNVFDRTLRNALVFDVVPRAEVANAVALNTIAFSTTRTLGPAVAGLLIAWIGPAWNFAIQGLLYSGLTATALMIGAAHRAQPGTVARGSAWRDMQAGLRFAVTHPVARMMLMLGLVPPILLIPSFGALMPVFAVKVFNTGPEGLGLLLSAVGAGCMLGGLLSASVARYDRVGLLQVLALLVFALALVGFALSPGIAVAVMFLIVVGMAEMVFASSNITTLQMSAPHEMRGRVASLVSVFPAFISLGAISSGIGADLLGPQSLVILLALTAAGIAAAAWGGSTVMRGLRLSKLVASGDVNAVPAGRH